ncbi:hypothetical protein [Microbacterium sp.]|uniref:hypothetical protein n=1 Tax=Microbacterium sp. TaxID=51671 RepID=UPI003A89B454
MSRRGMLWVAFVLVHVLVAWLGFVWPNDPMGDVHRVYEPWSVRALLGTEVVGIDAPWVYPQWALVPMVLAHAFTVFGVGYTAAWALLVTALDAVAFALLVGRGRSVGRATAALFWLAAAVLLGPVGMYRLEAITVPIAIVGCLWLASRPWAASMLLAVATWIKVWPAALLAAAVVALRRRLSIVGGAVVVSSLTLAAIILAGGWSYAFGFIGDQTGRGMQVEAPASTPYLWGALLGVEGFQVYYSQDMLTFEVTGTEIDTVIALMTPAMAVAALAVAVLGAVQIRRGARFVAVFPTLALALVTVLIVFNKVGSPQFQSWLIAPLVIGLMLRRARWVAPAVLGLILAGLTQLVYPLGYHGIMVPESLAVSVLTLRNVLLVALLVWTIVRLVRLPVAAPIRAPQPG